MQTKALVMTAYTEYTRDMMYCGTMQERFEEDYDAAEWSSSCKAMERAEGAHYDGYDPEAQADLAFPTYAELMGLDDDRDAAEYASLKRAERTPYGNTEV